MNTTEKLNKAAGLLTEARRLAVEAQAKMDEARDTLDLCDRLRAEARELLEEINPLRNT